MKRFMMFSVSVLCLAVAVLIGFYVGSQRVEAQAGGEIIDVTIYPEGSYTYFYVTTANADVFLIKNYTYDGYTFDMSAMLCGNLWTGSVANAQSTWGNVKKQK